MTQISGLLPMLPELVLACGAMLMLMVGVSVYQSERSAAIVNGFCVGVLALVAFILVMRAGRPHTRCSAAVSWSTTMRASSSC